MKTTWLHWVGEMYRVPAPVMKINVNADKALAELDLLLVSIRRNNNVGAVITNSAVVRRSGKPVVTLFTLLDNGTAAHDIGTKGDILANDDRTFGPIHGPVHHPAMPSLDISSRVQTFFETDLMVEVNNLADRGDASLLFVEFRGMVERSVARAINFAASITPDNWRSVKASYKGKVGGYVVDSSELLDTNQPIGEL